MEVKKLKPTEKTTKELAGILEANDGQLGGVYHLWNTGVRKNGLFVEKGLAANAGAAANLRATVEAIMLGIIPTGPSVARIARSAINSIIKLNPNMSTATRTYLDSLNQALNERVDDKQLQAIEEREMSIASEEIQKRMGDRSGVYVYSFPTYLREPALTSPDRWLYKVGKANNKAFNRVRQQTTGMPEAPALQRVYVHSTLTPAELENKFRRALLAAGHQSTRTLNSIGPKKSGPREWHATNLGFLDVVAEFLSCEIFSEETFGQDK
jgi:hypothetical protein